MGLKEAIEVMEKWFVVGAYDHAVRDAVIAAARSTLPKTKEIEVWHVEHFVSGTPAITVRLSADGATTTATYARELGDQCVRVTGPHKHLVPA